MAKLLLSFFLLLNLLPGAEQGATIEADVLVARKPVAIVVRPANPTVKIDAVLDMPSMPGMPVATFQFDAPAGSQVRIQHTFPHGGEYRLRLTLTADSTKPETIEFPPP